MTMIERAAKAIGDEQARRAGIPPQDIEPSERLKAITRAALLAALDAEDEALVESAAKRIFIERNQFEHDSVVAHRWLKERAACLRDARAAISALRSLVQGASQ